MHYRQRCMHLVEDRVTEKRNLLKIIDRSERWPRKQALVIFYDEVSIVIARKPVDVFSKQPRLANEFDEVPMHLVRPNVRAKRATTAGRAGQQAQYGPKAQRLMAGVACRWRSA